MSWAMAVIKQEGGLPVITQADPPYTNYVSMGDLPGNYGLYLVADTQARLIAADAISGVYGICLLTQSGDVKWAELDNVITPAMRNKINTFLSAKGYPTIPAGWTNKQAANAILARINAKFDLDDFWVMDK